MINNGRHIAPYQKWLNELQQFDQTQLTFNNTTGQDQLIQLWGANEGKSFQQRLSNFATGASPQAIAFDTIRQLLFVVNQLASSVDVFKASGEKVTTVLLEADEFAFASPLAIVIDETTAIIYVIGAFSNQLYVISPSFEVSEKIALDNRPIAMVLNQVSRQLYISHLLLKQVTVIDLNNSEIKARLVMDEVVTSMAIEPDSGAWLTVLPESNSIHVFSSANELTKKIVLLSEGIKKAVFTTEENIVLAITSTNRELIKVEISTAKELAKHEFTSEPISLSIGQNNMIYVATDEPASLHQFDQDLASVATYPLSSVHSALYISEESRQVYLPSPATNTVLVEALGEGQNIQASDNYDEVLKDFQNRPAIMRHLKVFYSGDPLAAIMRFGTKSSRGKKISKVVSLNQYRSPQHFNSIYEVFGSHGEIIDGSTFWELTVPKDQQLTIMLYYEQVASM